MNEQLENKFDYKKYLPILVVLIISQLMIMSSNMIFENSYLPDKLNRNVQYYKAEVIELVSETLEPDPYTGEFLLGRQQLLIRFVEGPFKGEQYDLTNYLSRLYNIRAYEGSNLVVACYIKDDAVGELSVYTYYRWGYVVLLAIIFFGLIILVGKFKGVKSIVSLIFTGVSVVYLMLPLMFRGVEPVVASLIVASLSTIVTLSLVSGRSKKTVNAIVGTICGVLIAALIAYIFGKLASLNGGTMEETEALLYLSETSGLKVKGLLFAGILIASLGAVMDVAMSISSAMQEFITVNPNISSKELIKSGMNVGTDMIGTMTNTLILALAGGSLNNFVLIFAADMDTVQMLNLQTLAVEFIQGLAGSIGIVLTVPITVFFGCYLYKNDIDKNNIYKN
ncbi:MAG: hypothetical protein ATN36_00835 [Epulopiscium sp. Nele67-Bin005]|nr:MAG: hypothetical protein ATN36_00835 [Epulopiscium sp. Nele67-Bin005]